MICVSSFTVKISISLPPWFDKNVKRGKGEKRLREREREFRRGTDQNVKCVVVRIWEERKKWEERWLYLLHHVSNSLNLDPNPTHSAPNILHQTFPSQTSSTERKSISIYLKWWWRKTFSERERRKYSIKLLCLFYSKGRHEPSRILSLSLPPSNPSTRNTCSNQMVPFMTQVTVFNSFLSFISPFFISFGFRSCNLPSLLDV